MAYCPQCGREQRCGCDECHSCGVPLIGSAADKPRSAAAEKPSPGAPAVSRSAETMPTILSVERPREVPINWIVHVFIILGMGILLVSCLEMANTAAHFPVLGPFSTLGEGLRRAGYYFGLLLYTGSVRLMTGFALLSAGFLIARRALDRPGWDKAVRATGLVMGGVGIVYLLTLLDLILPLGSPPYTLTALLPPLWAAAPILMVTGVALVGAGILMATRLSSERKRLSLPASWKRRTKAVAGDEEEARIAPAYGGQGARGGAD